MIKTVQRLAIIVAVCVASSVNAMQLPKSKPISPQCQCAVEEVIPKPQAQSASDILDSQFVRLREHEQMRSKHRVALAQALEKQSVDEVAQNLATDSESIKVSQKLVTQFADTIDDFGLADDSHKTLKNTNVFAEHRRYQEELSAHLIASSKFFSLNSPFAREQAKAESFRIMKNINKNSHVLRNKFGTIASTQSRSQLKDADICDFAALIACEKRYIAMQKNIIDWLMNGQKKS